MSSNTFIKVGSFIWPHARVAKLGQWRAERRPKATDSRSVPAEVRRFESGPSHHFVLALMSDHYHFSGSSLFYSIDQKNGPMIFSRLLFWLKNMIWAQRPDSSLEDRQDTEDDGDDAYNGLEPAQPLGQSLQVLAQSGDAREDTDQEDQPSDQGYQAVQ